MPTQRYALDRNGPKRLEISWGGFWKNVAIKVDGTLIGTIPGQKQLKAGQQFALPDGSTLSVQLAASAWASELRILRDGKPLLGSSSDPQQRLRTAYSAILLVAGLDIGLGFLGLVLPSELSAMLGLGVITVVLGLVFLALAVLVRRRSSVALIVAIVLLSLDALLGLVAAVGQGGTRIYSRLVLRLILLVFMAQGVGAAGELKKQAGDRQ